MKFEAVKVKANTISAIQNAAKRRIQVMQGAAQPVGAASVKPATPRAASSLMRRRRHPSRTPMRMIRSLTWLNQVDGDYDKGTSEAAMTMRRQRRRCTLASLAATRKRILRLWIPHVMCLSLGVQPPL